MSPEQELRTALDRHHDCSAKANGLSCEKCRNEIANAAIRADIAGVLKLGEKKDAALAGLDAIRTAVEGARSHAQQARDHIALINDDDSAIIDALNDLASAVEYLALNRSAPRKPKAAK